MSINPIVPRLPTRKTRVIKLSEKVFSQRLIAWYQKEKRDLPWRRQKDAYRVWVSEVMLQQTKVDTVIPYYTRFMERFPTLDSLSKATEEEVLKYWEGLGYYSRARNLHAAVKEVAATYGGIVPDEEERIRTLKGVGDYTTGAILSIAYDKPIPAVDGNVLRVISRIFAIERDIGKQSTRTEITELVRDLIPKHDPSSFNQALMELGALICIPRNPKCSICPVQALCVGKAEGKEKLLPMKLKKETKKDVFLTTVVYRIHDYVLIRQRQELLLKNLWEFPSWEVAKGTKFDAEMLRESALTQHGMDVLQFQYIGSLKHIFSHLRWNMEIYVADVVPGERLPIVLSEEYQWVRWGDLPQYPFPVPHQKVMGMVQTLI